MIDTAIAYIRQKIFADSGTALQSLHLEIYQCSNLERYYNVQLVKCFVETPLPPHTPLAERQELTAALQYLAGNPSTALLITGLLQLSPMQEERNEVLNLLLRKGYRLLCGEPLIDTRKLGDQQELRRNLQKSLV